MLFLLLLALSVEAAAPFPEGAWSLVGLNTGRDDGKLTIDGDAFIAETIHGQHSGTVAIRPGTTPAEIDFTITECDGCIFEGDTSRGIYRLEEDGTFVLVAPGPGAPRPTTFEGLDDGDFMIERATRLPKP